MSTDDNQDFPEGFEASQTSDAQTTGDMPIDAESNTKLEESALHALKVPSAQALQRAKPIFEQLLEKARRPDAKPASVSQAEQARGNASSTPVDKGQYPVASQYLGAVAPRSGDPDVGQTLPAHPPAGHAFVRASPPKASHKAAVVSQDLLEQTTQTALMWTNDKPQATTSFRLQFHDDVLKETTCLLTLHQKKLVATFYAIDADMRRLLEGHASRLEAQLSQRGLREVTIRVVQGDAPAPFEEPGEV